MKAEFINVLCTTKRKGVESLIARLEEVGFFSAPASTKFHLSYEGGLLQHSLNVYHTAMKVREAMITLNASLETALPKESVAIAALLHDVCKAEIYKQVVKRQKNSEGYWVDTLAYDVDYSSFPLGHGEKSVIVILRSGFNLTDDEIVAIRWHMHAWELPFQSYEAKSNLNVAKERCPLLSLIQAADGLAANLLENK